MRTEASARTRATCTPGCSVISDEEMYCSGDYDIDPAIVALICDGTDLIEDELYPTCSGK
jgi:hypothetical protein